MTESGRKGFGNSFQQIRRTPGGGISSCSGQALNLPAGVGVGLDEKKLPFFYLPWIFNRKH